MDARLRLSAELDAIKQEVQHLAGEMREMRIVLAAIISSNGGTLHIYDRDLAAVRIEDEIQVWKDLENRRTTLRLIEK